MSEELSNAASEAWIAGCAFLNAEPPAAGTRASVTDDFVYEDRRPGRLLGTVDADGWYEFLLSNWQTGAGDPQWRVHGVVAVRGDRFAACRYDFDYGNGMMSEVVEVIGLDPTLTLVQVIIDFDAGDVDEAIAELERLHHQQAETS